MTQQATIEDLKEFACDAEKLLLDLIDERDTMQVGPDKSRMRRLTKRIDYLLNCLAREYAIERTGWQQNHGVERLPGEEY